MVNPMINTQNLNLHFQTISSKKYPHTHTHAHKTTNSMEFAISVRRKLIFDILPVRHETGIQWIQLSMIDRYRKKKIPPIPREILNFFPEYEISSYQLDTYNIITWKSIFHDNIPSFNNLHTRMVESSILKCLWQYLRTWSKN